MSSKQHIDAYHLSLEEQASLAKLCDRACDRKIPDEHVSKFLSLGIVEINCGELSATRTGHSVLHAR